MVISTQAHPLDAEWLEADGLGGFASGTVGGARSRRYHELLLTATTPPTGRVVLVNGLEAWLETDEERFALSTQRYLPDVLHPDGSSRIVGFSPEPWPTWLFRAEDGTEIVQEILVAHERAEVVLRWRLSSERKTAKLTVRPLVSGRDYHSLHRENGAFRFDAQGIGSWISWRPYADLPAISVLANASYAHEPQWYRDFLYTQEHERGLDDVEDLASPGSFTFDLAGGDAVMVLRAGDAEPEGSSDAPLSYARGMIKTEDVRRRRFRSPLHRAADMYVVRRGQGRTVVAGYPWFTDWGRDTFISLRGLMTIPGGLTLARDILLAWSGTESRGMLPNRFPDSGEEPEYNSVDAALWFVVAAHDFLQAAAHGSIAVSEEERQSLRDVILRILNGYKAGSRYGVRADQDGLLAAGEPGVQLTWMDVKIGDWVVTPRIGKPVEIQALWLNAMAIAGTFSVEWRDRYLETVPSFKKRFWNAERGCLFDVVDANHVPGSNDATIRPNQILAVGGLPFQILDGEEARQVVQTVERDLLTPVGLRSLAPSEPGYRPHYAGGVVERDSAYHQGTVWPWLIGPFVEAWLRVEGDGPAKQEEARRRFLAPLLQHLNEAGIGHVSEILDAEPPHTPRGCPFQAWSLCELLRAQALTEVSPPQIETKKPAARVLALAAS